MNLKRTGLLATSATLVAGLFAATPARADEARASELPEGSFQVAQDIGDLLLGAAAGYGAYRLYDHFTGDDDRRYRRRAWRRDRDDWRDRRVVRYRDGRRVYYTRPGTRYRVIRTVPGTTYYRINVR